MMCSWNRFTWTLLYESSMPSPPELLKDSYSFWCASRSRKFNLDELQATKMTENNPGLPHAGLARFVPTRGKAKADMV